MQKCRAAASGTGNVPAASLLVARGASATVPDKFGTTPLHLAAANKRAPVLAALMAAHPDIAVKDELKTYAAQLAIDLAREKVRERMTPGDQETLVRNFVTDLSRQGTTS